MQASEADRLANEPASHSASQTSPVSHLIQYMALHNRAAEQNSNRQLLSTTASLHSFPTIKQVALSKPTPQNLKNFFLQGNASMRCFRNLPTPEASMNIHYTQYIGTTKTPGQPPRSLKLRGHLSNSYLKLSVFLQVL